MVAINSNPNTWWFFKETSQASIKTQELAATGDDEEPGPVPDQRFWLGASMSAQINDCKDPSKLLYLPEHAYNKIPTAKHPIKAGDTLWVYSLPVLGSTVTKIRQVMRKIHERKVYLKIYTIDLSVDMLQEERDYQILNRAFEQLEKIRKPAVKAPYSSNLALDRKGKRGRKPRGISFHTLTESGKRLIKSHCKEGTPSYQLLYEMIQDPKYLGKDIWGNTVTHLGYNQLRKIINEYRTILNVGTNNG